MNIFVNFICHTFPHIVLCAVYHSSVATMSGLIFVLQILNSNSERFAVLPVSHRGWQNRRGCSAPILGVLHSWEQALKCWERCCEISSLCFRGLGSINSPNWAMEDLIYSERVEWGFFLIEANRWLFYNCLKCCVSASLVFRRAHEVLCRHLTNWSDFRHEHQV